MNQHTLHISTRHYITELCNIEIDNYYASTEKDRVKNIDELIVPIIEDVYDTIRHRLIELIQNNDNPTIKDDNDFHAYESNIQMIQDITDDLRVSGWNEMAEIVKDELRTLHKQKASK